MIKNKGRIALGLCVTALLLGGVFFWKTSPTSGTTHQTAFNQDVRDALAEVNITAVSNIDAATVVSNNLANFISYRSGVQISAANKSLLAQNELKSREQSKKVSQDQLAQILTDVSFEKLTTLSDADIDTFSDTLRGFNSADSASVFRDGRGLVRLRADGEGTMEPTYFVNQLKSARDSEIRYKTGGRQASESDIYTAKLSRSALRNKILSEVNERTGYIATAQPNFFDGSSTNDMTPAQALLIVYSVVADDDLSGNQAELKQSLSDAQHDISQFWGQQYPNPQAYSAYGVNGYLYSTPTNVLLDEAATTRIINLISERSNLQ